MPLDKLTLVESRSGYNTWQFTPTTSDTTLKQIATTAAEEQLTHQNQPVKGYGYLSLVRGFGLHLGKNHIRYHRVPEQRLNELFSDHKVSDYYLFYIRRTDQEPIKTYILSTGPKVKQEKEQPRWNPLRFLWKSNEKPHYSLLELDDVLTLADLDIPHTPDLNGKPLDFATANQEWIQEHPRDLLELLDSFLEKT